MEGSAFFPTDDSYTVQMDEWSIILKALEMVLHSCVLDDLNPGFHIVDNDIIVAFWPRRSIINEMYGLKSGPLLGLSNVSTISSHEYLSA